MSKSIVDVLTGSKNVPRSFWFSDETLSALTDIRHDPGRWAFVLDTARRQGIDPRNITEAVDKVGISKNGFHPHFPAPQSITELLVEDIPPLHTPVEGLLHEGLWLFGGKSKRGKSYLMLDMAMAIAAGRAAWGHPKFATHKGRVLYLALEDGKRRIRERVLQIQPNLTTLDNLHVLYEFPRLHEGAIEMLAEGIQTYGYTLVIIDVLAKILSPLGKGSDQYLEFYKQFDHIRDLTRSTHTAIVAVDHLRKQLAEDVFDEIQGSVAKTGATDALMVLERKPNDPQAFLHVRSKDIGEFVHALMWHENRFQYLGEGEEYTLERDQQTILRVLHEEQRPMEIKAIMQAGGFPESSYGRVRKLLMMMNKEDLLHRTKRGQYAATIGIGRYVEDDDEPPF